MADDLANPRHLHTFEDTLDDLERLSRQHLLAFRIGAGRVLLRDCFDGDAHAYLDRNPHKAARFSLFVNKHAEDLARFGLSAYTAREAIVCCIVFDTLPETVREALFYSQILALSRLHDRGRRAELAHAAVSFDWGVRELRDAVAAARAGLPLDGDPERPGLQPPAAPPPPAPQAGRLVTRAEKWTRDLDAWAAQWQTVDPRKVRGAQRARLVEAIAVARARLDAMASGLEG